MSENELRAEIERWIGRNIVVVPDREYLPPERLERLLRRVLDEREAIFTRDLEALFGDINAHPSSGKKTHGPVLRWPSIDGPEWQVRRA
ncbi:MAG: hypothetical protein GTO63_30145 [Anaerolineae bacterium]|nr:hypothetical protein [Anaerolineae bacterium]NIN98967.1 hypothetical protein [Anaerolineae bacterium]